MIETLTRLLHDPRTERFVIALIVLNAVTLGLETSPTVMARIGPALHVLDTVILSVFVAELAARLFVQRLAFFRDGWNVFDFVVVGISLVPSTDTLSVLRSLRILRALRLVTAVPSLKRVVGALIAALPGMGSITLLLALIFYVGAVMATKLFGVCPPGVEGEACKAEHFDSLGSSIISLFQVMTLDAWADGLMKPMLKYYPWAWLFFIPFVLCSAFVALNLFIGVVVSAIDAESEAAKAAEAKGETLSHIPSSNLDVIAEVRALREEMARLREAMGARSG